MQLGASKEYSKGGKSSPDREQKKKEKVQDARREGSLM